MKKTFSPLLRASVAACAVSIALSGCFDGDDNDDDNATAATSQVPQSASDSVQGFIAYLQVLVVADAEGLEPVDTSLVTAPVDDTSEPTAIN